MALIHFAAALILPQADAQKRCVETLYNTGCNLSDCREKCYKKHNSVGGQCIANNPSMTDYSCVCIYNC